MTVALPPPPADTEDAILRLIVGRYPHGGSQLEAAVRETIRITWPAALGVRTAILEKING